MSEGRGDGARGVESTAAAVPTWEQSKENVLPLARGRDVVKIKRAFGESKEHGVSQAQKLSQLKSKYEGLIEQYHGEDPLLPWIKFIRAVRDEFPNDQREQFELLEACARKFKSEERYHNDARYIKIWISYADHLTNPSDLFMFLYKNGIGKRISLFWVAWAYVSEVRCDYTTAQKLLVKAKGLSLDDPDLISLRYKQFNRRMNRLWVNYQNEIGENKDSAISNGDAELTKEVLSTLKKHFASQSSQQDGGATGDPRRPGDENAGGPGIHRGVAGGGPEPRRGLSHGHGAGSLPLPASTSSSSGSNTAAFAVFDESKFGGDGASSTRALAHRFDILDDEGGAPGAWADFGTRRQRDQENIQAPTAWGTGGPLVSTSLVSQGARGHMSAAQTSAIPIFVEDEFRSETVASKPSRDAGLPPRGGYGGLGKHREQDGERLVQDPLLYMNDSEAARAHDRARSMRSAVKVREREAEHHSPKGGKDEEEQFEEIRARLDKYRIADESDYQDRHAESAPEPKAMTPVSGPDDADTSCLIAQTANPTSLMMNAPETKGRRDPVPKRALFSDSVFSPGGSSLDSVGGQKKSSGFPFGEKISTAGHQTFRSKPKAEEEDMTINTKLAFEDLNDIFSSPRKEEESPQLIVPEAFTAFAAATGEVGSPVIFSDPPPHHDGLGDNFHVFEDPDGRMGQAAMAGTGGGPPGNFGFSVFVEGEEADDATADRENEHRVPNPAARNLRDPGVENSVFRVLEERPQDSATAGVDSMPTEEPLAAAELRPPPTTGRRRALGSSIIMDELPPRRTNGDIIRAARAGDASLLAGDHTFSVIEDDPPLTSRRQTGEGVTAGGNSVLFSVYDDIAPIEHYPHSVSTRNRQQQQQQQQITHNFSIFGDENNDAGLPSGGAGPAGVGFLIHSDECLETEGGGSAGDQQDLFAGPFTVELSRIAESGEEESFGIFSDQQVDSAARGGRLNSWRTRG